MFLGNPKAFSAEYPVFYTGIPITLCKSLIDLFIFSDFKFYQLLNLRALLGMKQMLNKYLWTE